MNNELFTYSYSGNNMTPLLADTPKKKRQTQEYRDRNGNIMEREKKRNGVMGTSPKEHIILRQTIVRDIIEEHPDFSGKEVRDELLKIVRFESRYSLPADFKVPTYATILRDLKNIEAQDIQQKKGKQLYKEDEFQHFSRKYGSYIRQVRIKVLNQEYLFYPITDNNGTEITLQYYIDQINSIKNEILKFSVSQYALVHLLIIFSETGFEDFLSRLFKRECESVLYTNVHNYCAEIVLECNDFNDIFITNIYNLLPRSILIRPEISEETEDVENDDSKNKIDESISSNDEFEEISLEENPSSENP